MSRTSDIGYQQALDVVARGAGHGTWSAMVAAHMGSEAPQHVRASPTQATTGWRIRALERLEGSRHSSIDEAGIASVGRMLVRLADIIGVPVIAIAAMLPVACWPIARSMLDGSPGESFFDAMLTIVPIVLFGIGTLRSPDHRGARRIRRTSRVLCFMFLVVCASFMLSTKVIYGPTQIDALSMAPARLIFALVIFTVAMWACAWEGRRRRRTNQPLGSVTG